MGLHSRNKSTHKLTIGATLDLTDDFIRYRNEHRKRVGLTSAEHRCESTKAV